MEQERPTNFMDEGHLFDGIEPTVDIEELAELTQVLVNLREEQAQIPSPHKELVKELGLILRDVLKVSSSIINKWRT